MMMGGGVASSGGGYLLGPERFTSGSEPASGWSHVGSPNYGYTTDILEGDYSVYVTNPDSQSSASFTASDTVYITMLIKIPTALISGAGFFVIQNNTTSIADIRVSPNGAFTVRIGASDDRYGNNGDLTFNSGTYIKMRVTAGSGSNGIVTVWTSGDGTTWTQRVSATNGANTAQANKATWWGPGYGYPMIFDVIKISTSDIADAT